MAKNIFGSLRNKILLGASLVFGFNSLFPSLSYAEILRRRTPVSVEVNENGKTFSVSKQVENEKEAKDYLSLYFVEKEEERLEKENKNLEEKIKDFFWQNPTPFSVYIKENPSTIQFEAEENMGFQTQFVEYDAGKKQDCFEFKSKLKNQDYFFQWDKSCGIVFISPEGSKVFRKYFDKVYVLDLQNSDKSGNFEEIIDKNVDLKEVAEFGVDILLKKHKEDILAMPEAVVPFLLFRAVNWLQETEKEKIEDIADLKGGNIYVSKFTPPTYFPSQNEIGRKIFIGFKGKPERIEVFINGILKENPLKKQYSGTNIRKDYLRFVKHYSIYPFKSKNYNKSLIDVLLNMNEGYSEILEEFKGKMLKDFHEKDVAYDAISLRANSIPAIISWLEENKNRDVSDMSEIIREIHERVQKASENRKTLREILNEYKYSDNNKNAVKSLKMPEEIFQWYLGEYGKNVDLKEEKFIVKKEDLNFDNILEYIISIKCADIYTRTSDMNDIRVWQNRNSKWEQIYRVIGYNCELEVVNDRKPWSGYKLLKVHTKYGTQKSSYLLEYNYGGYDSVPR